MRERTVSLRQNLYTPILFRAVITSYNSLDALEFHCISPLDIITGFKLCKYMKQKAMNDTEVVVNGARRETQHSGVV